MASWIDGSPSALNPGFLISRTAKFSVLDVAAACRQVTSMADSPAPASTESSASNADVDRENSSNGRKSGDSANAASIATAAAATARPKLASTDGTTEPAKKGGAAGERTVQFRGMHFQKLREH